MTLDGLGFEVTGIQYLSASSNGADGSKEHGAALRGKQN